MPGGLEGKWGEGGEGRVSESESDRKIQVVERHRNVFSFIMLINEYIEA